MYKLEDTLKTVFIVFMLVLAVIEVVGLFMVFFNWQVGLVLISVPIALAIAVAFAVVYRVPAAYIGVPESLIVGRFKAEKFEECGCSVPIARATVEGLNLKWPWHKIHLMSREIDTHRIDKERYDIKEGAVIVSGNVQRRTSLLCAYRKLAISPEDVRVGMAGLIDQVMVKNLIEKELEEALQLKGDLREAIDTALSEQKMVDNPNDPNNDPKKKEIGRTLYGEEVTVSQHRFGDEIVSVNIDKIDPVQELQDARNAVQVESLKKKQAEKKMERYAHVRGEIKKEFNLSDEKTAELFELAEGLSTKEKKLYGLSDLTEIGEIMKGLAAFLGKGGK